MRKLILLSLILLCLTVASAGFFDDAKRIEKGTYYSGETIVAKNQVFTVIVSTSLDKIGLMYDGELEVINENSCQRIGDLGFCVEDIEEEIDESEERGKRKAVIEVYDLIAKINVSREITEGSLIVGEDTTIEVKLTNEGEEDTQVVYIDEFPKGIEIVKAKNALIQGNRIYWSGLLRDGKDVEFEYDIRAVGDVDSKLKARLEYDDEKYYSDDIKLISKTVLKHIFDWEFNPVVLEQETNLNVTLKNLEDDEIEVKNFTIIFPEALQVWKGSLPIKEYSWEGDIKENRTKKFHFTIEAIKSGGHDIITKTLFEFKDKKNLSVTEKETLEVKEAELIIRIGFGDPAKKEKEIESLQSKWFRVDIQKPNEEIELHNINVTINGSAVNATENIFLDILDEEDNKRVANIRFDAPEVSRTRQFKLNVFATFESEYGEKKTVDEDFKITVRPVKDLTITHDVDRSIESGEDIEIIVSIDNPREIIAEDIKVCHFFNISPTTRQCKILSIDEDRKVDVFAYEIRAPRVNETIKYLMFTNLSYRDDWHEYSVNKETIVNVKEPDLKLELKRSVDSRDVFVGNIVDVDYKLRNREDETLSDITIYFEPSQYFDIVGNLSYFVGNLDPDEVINLYGIEQIRPKVNDTQYVEASTAFYKDLFFGRTHNDTSSRLRLKVDNGFISGPMFIINKTVPKLAYEYDYFTVNLTITNIGSQAYGAIIHDNNMTWNRMIYTRNPAVIRYNMSLESIGKRKLEKALVKYSYQGRNYTTASDTPEVIIKKLPEVKIEKPEKEKLVEKVTKKVQEDEDKRTIMQQIIDFFRGLFK